MFRKTSPQSSLLEVDCYLANILPENDWSSTYKNRVLPLIEEDKFQHFYSDLKGRYNAPVRAMISILIFMGQEKLNWRSAEFQFPRRLDWLLATNTPLAEANIDHTTLFKFYQRLEQDDTAARLFTKITEAFIKACGSSLKKQRTDSFFIHGWLRKLSRYGLFKETIRNFLKTLRKQKPKLYENIKQDLSQDYVEQDFDLTEKDHELVQRRIALMAQDLYRLKNAFENHSKIKKYDTFKILCKVFSQQCKITEHDNGDSEIVIKEKPDKGAICTPHNVEARYKRKGKQKVTGDQGFITETCDSDNKVQFFTDIEVTAATASDAKQQPQIQQRLIDNDFKPDAQYGDAGFVNGTTILASKDNGIELHGATAGRSQSFEAYDSNDRPLDAGDFDITITEPTNELIINKCPNNQIPTDQSRSDKTGKMMVHFDPEQCNRCEKAQRCPVKIGKRVATYTVSESEYIGAVRQHQYMSDPAYRKQCAIRAGVEASVSELTRGYGMRKSRHRKRSRTKLQLIFAALACNVRRFIRYGEQYAYLEPKFT
jgi:hypothetical protein